MQTIEYGLDEHHARIMQAVEELLTAARSAGNTTLAEAAAAGTSQITVGSVTGFAAGDILQVGSGTAAETHQVAAVDAGALRLTLARPLRYAQGAGATVKGALQDVSGLVRGDRADAGQIEPPLLWLMDGVDRIEPAGGVASIHNVEVIVAALVVDSDPATGRRAAANLAARAYNVLLLDRNWKGTVHQVVPARFEPAQRMAGAKQAFWAAVICTGQVRRRD